ncbi:helix-turn-helix domain-containing protein [Aquimarina sp. AU474]|uniref:helix-turn-helix domain-containing protein n=1 Tax=Aquimarina sp. AU474 TaxID=2108529 RepID=UPI000D686201|nr:helix-turn-helix domain-containing protein [Aquimarina sp. AU474]
MEVFFFIGIAISSLLALLIFSKEKQSFSDKIFGVWQIILVFHFSLLYIRHSDIIYKYPHFIGIDTSFVLLYIPFIFFYTRTVINKRLSYKNYVIHLLPFLLVNLGLLFSFYLMPGVEKLTLFLEQFSRKKIYSIVDLIVLIQALVYFPLLIVMLKKYNNNISKKPVKTDTVTSFWLEKIIIGACFIIGINFIIYFFYLSTDLFSTTFFSKISIINICLFQASLGYLGIKHTSIFTFSTGNKKTRLGKYHKTGLKKVASEKHFKILIEYMTDNKPYLDPDLNRNTLASQIGISSNHLSQIINQKTNHNFYAFVNEFRIKEAKKILQDHASNQYTILAIANDSGFKSKSVFNELFKKQYGMTPSQFRKSNTTSK